MIVRFLRHLGTPAWLARRPFDRAALDRIEAAVRASEAQHEGELRIALEAGMPMAALLRAQSPRERAIDLFSQLRVWDTAHNSGVFIYLQLVDREIEIVADRGINARVRQDEWDAICRGMEQAFAGGRFEDGVLSAIAETTAILARHFPPSAAGTDELPDRPEVL